jgi:hypothetical protein
VVTTTSPTPTTSQKMALLKRQGHQAELIEESIAESDKLLSEKYPGILDGALAVRERFGADGRRITARDSRGQLLKEGQLVLTIATQAVIEYEGQRVLVENVEDVRTDEQVRAAILLRESWAGQALVEWSAEENWIARIKVIKRNGPKGSQDEVLHTLVEGPEEWSSALLLLWHFYRQEALGMLTEDHLLKPEQITRMEEAINSGERDMQQTQASTSLLMRGPAQPSPFHIIGI